MSSETPHIHAEGEHEDTMSKGRIGKVALILSAITCVEFFIALYLVPHQILSYHSANPIYIVLTLLKAFYIVAFFMHLKFEKKGLILAVAVPTLFIIGLILVLTNESHHWLSLR
ncbi:cytochrome c oxidase subunit IV [Mucilaginibacter gracilis]|uniref:Cytochrome c oxidase subunit IV n=1 Tax=Mucilaginibacter gracilis TaxID=423350 RepID=A0A495IYH3_9SPHI|nr:cytochrome C oxidase subunit IV family protein [Mucilaginibacter gracilis]RKR81431.1 cytochrome c oxidase subunit IV [Mucilaginibacter gracilis]